MMKGIIAHKNENLQRGKSVIRVGWRMELVRGFPKEANFCLGCDRISGGEGAGRLWRRSRSRAQPGNGRERLYAVWEPQGLRSSLISVTNWLWVQEKLPQTPHLCRSRVPCSSHCGGETHPVCPFHSQSFAYPASLDFPIKPGIRGECGLIWEEERSFRRNMTSQLRQFLQIWEYFPLEAKPKADLHDNWYKSYITSHFTCLFSLPPGWEEGSDTRICVMWNFP